MTTGGRHLIATFRGRSQSIELKPITVGIQRYNFERESGWDELTDSLFSHYWMHYEVYFDWLLEISMLSSLHSIVVCSHFSLKKLGKGFPSVDWCMNWWKSNPLTGSISEFRYSWHLSNFICESFNSSDRFFLHLCYTFYSLICSIFRRVTWWCTHKKATAFDCDTKKNNTSNWWKCYDTRCCLSRFWVRFGPDLQRPNRTNSTNVKTCLCEINCTSSEFFY